MQRKIYCGEFYEYILHCILTQNNSFGYYSVDMKHFKERGKPPVMNRLNPLWHHADQQCEPLSVYLLWQITCFWNNCCLIIILSFLNYKPDTHLAKTHTFSCGPTGHTADRSRFQRNWHTPAIGSVFVFRRGEQKYPGLPWRTIPVCQKRNPTWYRFSLHLSGHMQNMWHSLCGCKQNTYTVFKVRAQRLGTSST